MTTFINFLDILAKVGIVVSVIFAILRTVSLMMMPDLVRIYRAYGGSPFYDSLKGPAAFFIMSAAWLLAPYV